MWYRQRNIDQTIKCEQKLTKQKTRPPKTLKCSKSKTIRHRKLKSSHHVDLIRSIWCELFSFLSLIVLDLEHFKVLGSLVFVCCLPFIFQLCTFVTKIYLRTFLLQNFNFQTFVSQILNISTFLSPGKFCTQKYALRKVFNFSASASLEPSF